MRIRVACLDQEILWIIDDIISGLYSINLITFETECVIDYRKLLLHGKFEVLSLLKWKDDYIIIIPREIDRSWILYNKITREVEYRKVIEKKCQEIMVVVDENRNQLYIFPLYICDPILIVDLSTLTCLQMIENWNGRGLSDCCQTAWKGAYNGKYVFSPIKNTRILVRMNCGTRKVSLLELGISEGVIDVDYAFGELWVLPMSGNLLYQIDEDGKIVNIVELLIENVADPLPGFARIVAQKRYLFLLPYYHEGIYVYDKLERKTYVMLASSRVLEEKNGETNLRYWEYFIRDNQICFLPYQDSYIEFDLDTLAYKTKELFYPTIWSDEEKIRKCICSHVSEEDSVVREMDICGLEIFLKYIQYKMNTNFFSINRYDGKGVWDIVKN